MVHNYYQQAGGEDTVVNNEKKLLEDHGNSVFLYTRNNKEINDFGVFKKLLLPLACIFNIKTYIDISKILENKNINIIHVHNTILLISPSVFYVAKKFKIPVVNTLHNFRMECANGLFYHDGVVCEECLEKGIMNSIKYKCYRNSFLETFLMSVGIIFHRIAGIYKYPYYICLTDFNKQKLMETKVVKNHHVFIKPNFVFPIERKKEKKELFVYAGRIEKIKGISLMLEAWKQLGNDFPRLVLCGSGELDEEVEKFISDNNIKNVVKTGHIQKEKVMEIINKAYALIIPSQVYEGFPMTILEANALGVPVIGSDLGNVGNLINNNINGIRFNHNSSADLADKCQYIYKNPMAVDENFIKKYSAEENYNSLIKIYKEAIKENESIL